MAAALPRTIEDVVCPFCSLACDDLVVEAQGASLRLMRPPCPIAEREFARPSGPTAPLVDGTPAGLDEAVAHAAALLEGSRLPLFAGLGTDLAGMRAVLALAEWTGGIVDHAGSTGLIANLRTMQDGGWVTTTLAEIRNRADLVLFVGTDASALAPRFVERCLAPRDTLFGPIERELVYLGDGLQPAERLDAAAVSVVPCPPERLSGTLAALRALSAGARPARGDAPPTPLEELALKLRRARYPVIVWAAAALPGRHADLIVGTLAGLIKELNSQGRCAGLPLSGPNNVVGVNQVCAWQTGVPLRTSFAAGVPDHDPVRWSVEAVLRDGAADALVWIASLCHLPLPPTVPPTVALIRAGDPPPPAAEVVIPVGQPGLDHAGSLYRTDSVVAVPVAALRVPPVAPSAATVLEAIRQRLGRPAG